jgi:hypothetical protein
MCFGRFNRSVQQFYLAFPAGSFAAAWKFNPEFVQNINQRSLIVHLNFFSDRVETDGMFFH